MKENLQNKFDNFEGPYDFSGTEWQGLEERLNKRDLVPLGLLSLLAGLLLLGLLGSSIFLWRQNTALNQRLSSMETTKFSIEKTTATPVEKAVTTTILMETDTIRKRRIIYQYDTIYRKITVVETQYITPQYTQQSTTSETTILTKEATDKAVQARPNTSTTVTTSSTINSITVPTTNLDNTPVTRPSGRESQQQNGNNTSKLPNETAGQTPQYPNEKTDKNADNAADIQEKQTILMPTDTLNEKETIAQKPVEVVADSTALMSMVTAKKPFTKDSITMKKNPFDSLDIVKKDDKKGDDKTGKKHPKYVFKMLPLYVGGVLGLPVWSKASVIGQNGNQYGLKVEAVATERVRFFAEMNYSKNADSKSIDLAMLPTEIAKPTVEPGMMFKYWETNGIKSFNYILGVQYQWGKEGDIHPYIAAAFNATTTLPFEVDFEYINKLTSVEKKYLQPVTRLGHLNRIYGALGVHWNAFPNGQFAAETYFTTPINGDKSLTPTQLGLKIGAFYFIR
jgi:hypothetical protein